jgi:hypothetical protein
MLKISRHERESEILSLTKGSLYSFVGWDGVFSDGKSKFIMNCPLHGNWSTRLANLRFGSRCKQCAVDQRRMSEDEITCRVHNVLPHGYRLVDISSRTTNNNTSKVIIRCPVHGDSEITVSHVLHSGTFCRRCGLNRTRSKRSLPEPKALSSCIDAADAKGYTLVRLDNYRNASSKVILNCKDHGDWVTNVKTVRSMKHGCPKCRQNGFNAMLDGFVYHLVSDCGVFSKVGITHDLARRMTELKRETPFGFQKVWSIKLDGQTATTLEHVVHDLTLQAGFSGFNGATEWFVMDDVACFIITLLLHPFQHVCEVG